ncbi:HEAT repeat domain-containing protein [Aureibacter tunicatorum]|uniref:HEAT repeat protein n=1 Tax=Aureibacter tunicatorum TaxID=866807 RepID=A0AAE3XK85_9BACT|nr:HEAT repeat domain-containing protein [Aureibacter tunicatorum]MDR6238427.1 HEAT repeat protein [Aureibacter tunicatorum]BDD03459.1 hypothetical protein AUTU_09420 [Aureibacter tunicatorum]
MGHREHAFDLTEFDFPAEVKELLYLMMDRDGIKRKKARQMMVKRGEHAIPYLLQLVNVQHDQFRWEIVKSLEEISDKSLIPTFLTIMNKDENSDIRTIAAKGMARLGRLGIIPLLEMLIRGEHLFYLYDTSVYVLRSYNDFAENAEIESLIDKLLESEIPNTTVPPIAEKILNEMTGAHTGE